ncbi:alpha/beta fold hydrolase [Streptomyces javensis]|uniref:Alpha/beta hydrolase n=1 Tax=Streptomyces javensis TaxID=114698 RepID=A0ABS0RSY8_9ACTN|nr:alpha/beta hydrolase [Streptomyces javensis]MBI0319816.1 alpha/beta hydrolase [Streptomyces javensis]
MPRALVTGIAATAVATVLLTGSGAVSSTATATAPRQPQATDVHRVHIQDDFDSLGPEVRALKLDSGRTAHYIDDGPRDGKPVLYIGGTGTSARVAHMTDFLRSTPESLGLRLISVERNGFGDTEFDKSLGKADFARDALQVLDRIGVRKVSVIAISGGGPYAAELASLAPDRVSSLHLAAALPPYGAQPPYCSMSDEELGKSLEKQIADPRVWWALPDDSPTKRISGFADTAFEDGARTYNQRGQKADPAAQVHEQKLYCQRPGPDLSKLTAPVTIYSGKKDTTVPPSTIDTWKQHLPGNPAVRSYADTGHDVQYRHWDQILVDLAGHTDRTVICYRGHSTMPPARIADPLVEKGRATLGSCAWRKAGKDGPIG